MFGFILAVVISVVVSLDTPVFATEIELVDVETVLLDTETSSESDVENIGDNIGDVTEELDGTENVDDTELIDVPDIVSPDLSELSDTLDSIDEKLDTVVLALDSTVDSYQVSDYYQNYFRGVLQNMPYTEYLCYAQRIQSGSGSYSYVTHYYLMYDLKLEDGQVVAGTYPCIDVYTQDNVYVAQETTKTFSGYPTLGFASFAPYSALIDRSVDYQNLFVGLISVLVMFIVCRKTVFS